MWEDEAEDFLRYAVFDVESKNLEKSDFGRFVRLQASLGHCKAFGSDSVEIFFDSSEEISGIGVIKWIGLLKPSISWYFSTVMIGSK